MNNTEYFSQFDDEKQWEALRDYYGKSPKGNTYMAKLANECGYSWFDSRADDTPKQFIKHSWYRMNNLRGFGKKKMELLLNILVANFDIEEFSNGVPVIEEQEEPQQLEIEGWKTFPLTLSFCASRTKTLFESVSLRTPNDLVGWYEEFGERGVLTQGNTGRKTLTEIQQIYGGWKHCDLTRLQTLLPIDEQLEFTLQDYILGYYSRLKEDYQAALYLRLVEQYTLEECGSTLKVTRERIRQIERTLLSNVELALEYFSEQREELFSSWQKSGNIPNDVKLSGNDQAIYQGSIQACFERSNEGKEAIAHNEETTESLVQEIREQWSYYCDGVTVTEFLQNKGLSNYKENVLESAKNKSYFQYDESTDKLTPAKALLKHAALACLQCSGQHEWKASDWLMKLRESERFNEVDLTHLKHLYSNWRNDSDFKEFPVDFSTSQSIEITDELECEIYVEPTTERSPSLSTGEESTPALKEHPPERLEMIRATVQRSISRNSEKVVPSVEDPKARGYDLQIRAAIEEAQSLSSEDTLLGFLNLDEDEQGEVLSFTKEALAKGDADKFLRRYPALGSYALTLAAAVGLQDKEVGSGSFYRAWDFSIGWSPATSSRKRIAKSYIAALKHLDLGIGSIFVEHELDWKGGCYLFHAAVLPHFISPLEVALQSVQRELPLPDPDEPEQIQEFAKLLANRVEQGQRRLKAVLESSVGALLVRRLVLWHMTGDPELFPPFILNMLKEQKSAGQETIIKRPYIVFDSHEEALFLELPAQSNKISNSRSKWIVNGRAFRADTAREPIRLSEIVAPETEDITVEIEGLQRKTRTDSYELRKQVYKFQTNFSKTQPFRVFRELDGREVRFHQRRNQIELSLGEKYLALLDDEIEIDSEHESDECELGRIVEFEMNFNSPSLALNDGENEWTIKPKIKPGAFVHREDALSFEATDLLNDYDVKINYGTDFGLTLALPNGVHSGTVAFDSNTTNVSDHSADFYVPNSEDHLSLIDLSSTFTSWLNELEAGIYEIIITVSPEGRKPFKQTFWYWKGLDYVTQSGDLYYSTYPINLGVTNGYQKIENRLEYSQKGSKRAEFTSVQSDSGTGFRLRIPQPGVEVTITSNEGEILESNPLNAIDILPNDTRLISFQHGGLAPVKLMSGDFLIGQVDGEKRSITRSLGALVADLGKTGEIYSKAIISHTSEKPRKVIRWRTPKVVNHCRAVENEEGEYSWELTGLSSHGLQKIRVRLYDLQELPNQNSTASAIEVELPEHSEHIAETCIAEGFSIEVSLNHNDCYRFIFNYDRHQFEGAMHIIEMDCMIVDSNGWQQLSCNEGHSRLSDLRLLFKGHPPETTEDGNLVHHVFWGDLNNIEFGHALDLNIGQQDQIKEWLHTARWLVNYRYPKIVWEKYNFRLKALYHGVTKLAVENECSSNWWQNATAGLEEHANRKTLTATIAPCLLFGAAYTGPFPTLDGSTEELLSGEGLITKCFIEASRAAAAKDGALEYIQTAFQGGHIDQNFLGCFSSLPQLFQMKNVPLNGFSFVDWNSKLSARTRHASFDDIKDEFQLLDPDHYLVCIRKLSERAKSLDSIRSKDTSHWLSPHISKLNQLADHGSGILRQITGNTHEELWEPFESSELLLLDEDLRSLVNNAIKASGIMAAIYCAVNKGLISIPDALHALEHEFGNEPNRSETLRFLIIGTAPELIAYFYLFFALTLEHPTTR